jgi:hypothetical protein
VYNNGANTAYLNFGGAATASLVPVASGEERFVPCADASEIRVIGTAAQTVVYWSA